MRDAVILVALTLLVLALGAMAGAYVLIPNHHSRPSTLDPFAGTR